VLQGKRIVYDSHEHYGALLASDPLFPQPFKGIIRAATDIFERLLTPFADAVITVDEDLAGKYRRFGHKNVSIVANYPQLDTFDSIPASDRDWDLIYVGGLSDERGIFQMIEAAERTNCSLACIGYYANMQNEEKIKNYIKERGCSNVHIIGRQPQPDAISAIKSSKICFSILHPSPIWDTAVPVKLLEYMSCKKPVIASDLPGISSVVKSAECGLTVNPSDVDSIVIAVQYLLDHPKAAAAMAENGRRVTETNYNWRVAEGVLYDVMRSLAH
jgi:glycosyltransferase involved in cell wall biosynthesis